MKYKNKKIIVTGFRGFIGKAVSEALVKEGANVTGYSRDIRDYRDFATEIDHTFDYVFHFAAPSSQVLFARNAEYCADVTINGFLNVARACRKNNVKLIYPSTGLLSQGKQNEYARAKKICEDIHLGQNLDALGLRIFAGYGIGEGHKRDYASVPYLFVRDVLEGREPVIFGTGDQSRDFIYIDDLVQAILVLAEHATEPIVDVGSGESVTFNQIIKEIESQGFSIHPSYVDIPKNYIDKTTANTSLLKKYQCEAKTPFWKGVRNILQYEKGNSNNNN